MKEKIKKIHMVGIGGSGMSGIAEILINLGYEVTGSDLTQSPVTRHLGSLGATIFTGHAAENLQCTGEKDRVDVVVQSSAVQQDNPEVQQARQCNIPVIRRAEMLAELMRLRTGIAVGGTHGKTTTTSFLASVFAEAQLDPTVVIGGLLNAYGSNARLGQGEYLIAEADESDGSFLCLCPIVTVVTNIDRDHMDFYPDAEAIGESFVRFMNTVPFYGINVVCLDDPGVQAVLPQVNRPVLTYGFSPEAMLRAQRVECDAVSCFDVFYRDVFWGHVVLNHPGRHNVLNALGAIGVAIEAGLPREAIIAGLKNFTGVGRRFEKKGEQGGVLVIDDYGHHPTEIAATLATARECFPDKRLVVAFQPHRFSRTKALFGEFCTAFQKADVLLLSEIYPASETPIPGVSGMSLARGIRQITATDVHFFENFTQMSSFLPELLHEGDLLLTLGAGNIWQVGQQYLETEKNGTVH